MAGLLDLIGMFLGHQTEAEKAQLSNQEDINRRINAIKYDPELQKATAAADEDIGAGRGSRLIAADLAPSIYGKGPDAGRNYWIKQGGNFGGASDTVNSTALNFDRMGGPYAQAGAEKNRILAGNEQSIQDYNKAATENLGGLGGTLGLIGLNKGQYGLNDSQYNLSTQPYVQQHNTNQLASDLYRDTNVLPNVNLADAYNANTSAGVAGARNSMLPAAQETARNDIIGQDIMSRYFGETPAKAQGGGAYSEIQNGAVNTYPYGNLPTEANMRSRMFGQMAGGGNNGIVGATMNGKPVPVPGISPVSTDVPAGASGGTPPLQGAVPSNTPVVSVPGDQYHVVDKRTGQIYYTGNGQLEPVNNPTPDLQRQVRPLIGQIQGSTAPQQLPHGLGYIMKQTAANSWPQTPLGAATHGIKKDYDSLLRLISGE